MKEKRRENIIIVSIVTVAIIVLAVVLLNNSNVFKKSSNTTSKTQDAKQYESFINELSNYVENSDPNKDYDTTKSDFVTEVIDLQKKYQDSTGVSYAANTLINVTPSVSYTCPNNSYTLTGTTCTSQGSNKIAASVRYSCDANGTLSGTSCIYKTSPSYSFGYYPRCYTGTYNYMDRMCHYTKQANISYYCPNGTLDGNSCVIGSNNVIQATKKYTCPSGYTLAGTQCAKTSGVKATPKYMCTDDTELRGSKCYATIMTDAVGMYSCDDGFVISGTKCLKNDFPRASKKYTCSKAYTLNGGKCEKYEIINAKVHYADKK